LGAHRLLLGRAPPLTWAPIAYNLGSHALLLRRLLPVSWAPTFSDLCETSFWQDIVLGKPPITDRPLGTLPPTTLDAVLATYAQHAASSRASPQH